MRRITVATQNICQGPILPNILKFAIPVIIGNLLQILFNAVDMVVVGKFIDSDALAAVGSNISLVFLLTNLFVGLSIGANVVTARFCGAGSASEVEKAVHCSMAVCIASGVFLALFGIVISKFSLELLGTPDNILDDAVLYLRVCAVGFPFTMIFNFTRAIVNAEGDTKFPLYCLIVAGVTNVLLDLLFIIVMGLGIFGVGAATVLANVFSATIMINHLCRKKSMVKLEIKKIRFDRDMTVEIIKVGLPAGLQGVAFSVSNVIVQGAVNTFGATVVAGNTAVINIEGFLYMVMFGFYQASSTFVSQNYGAGQFDRIKSVLKCCLLCAAIGGFTLGLVAIVFREGVIGFYATDPDVISAGAIRILVVFPVYFLCGLNDVISGAMRGIGHSNVPLVISLTGACVLRIVWIFTVFAVNRTLIVLYISYPISWVLTFIAHAIAFRIFYKKLINRNTINNN